MRQWRLLTLDKNTNGSSKLEDGEGESGFLYLPDDDLTAGLDVQLETGLRTLPELLASPAVVLLGRPGSGKTTEMKSAREKGLFLHEGAGLIYREARAFEGTASDLLSEVDAKLSAKQRMTLVLDGADELLMEHAKFLNSLEAGLEERKHEGRLDSLRLIISCRAAEWPEGKLSHLWPQGQFTVARLCQLDWKSADDFVSEHLPGQSQAFWAEVNALKILFLAIWPHSLAALVEEFRENDGHLPGTLFELVHRAAWRRCDVHHSETDSERRERLYERDVPQSWSYRLAARAATLGCFSGHTMFSIHPGDVGQGFISADDFRAGVEPLPDGSLRQIEQKDLTDLKRLAVFDSLASGKRLVFTHQLMREFLAASWLADRGVPVIQLEVLFGCHREDGSWRHYPQLAAIAAWLASHPEQKAWRTFLIANDPAVLMRADAASLADIEKQEIAKALLECAVRDRAVDPGWEHHQFRGLACDGLAAILRPYILNDSDDNEAARSLAIDIVRETQVASVAEALWGAVRPAHAKQRPAMAYALIEISRDTHEREWREVLDGDIPLDDQGALLGAALDVMVPSKLKVRDVLHHLIPEHDFGIIGLYSRTHDLMVERMEKADALPVVRHSAMCHASGFAESWKKNQESLLSKALRWLAEDMDQPEIMAAFVEWWHSASINHRHKPSWNDKCLSLEQLGFEVPERRHLMVETAVNHTKLEYMSAKDHFWHGLRVFIRSRDDMMWLARKLCGASNRQEQIWAILLSSVFYNACRLDDDDLKRTLLRAFDLSSELRGRLPMPSEGRDVFEEIIAQAEASSRRMVEEEVEWSQQTEQWKQEQQEELKFLFQEARRLYDEGDWRAWEWITRALFYEQSPSGGMLALSHVEKIHDRNEAWMYDAAHKWLAHEAPLYPLSEDADPGRYGIEATWALYALWDRLDGDAEVLNGVYGWLPHIFSNMLRSSWEAGDFTVEHCLKKFTLGSLNALLAVFRADYVTNSSMWSLQHLAPLAREAVPGIKQMMLRSSPQPKGFRNTLAWLAKQDLDAAEEVASHWLKKLPDNHLEAHHLALLGAIILHLNGRLWSHVKSVVCQDHDTASRVLLTAFADIGFHLPSRLDVSQWPTEYLTEVVVLMASTFPPDQDPKRQSSSKASLFSGVTPRDEVTRARNTLFDALAERGKPEAVAKLEALGLHGTDFWFRHLHLRASLVNQASRWNPRQPQELLLFVAGHDLKLAETDDDLMRAVLIYLEMYAREIGTTSHGQALLNQDGTPKHEEWLSDHLAQWLQDRHGLRRIRENQTPGGKKEDITIAFDRPGKAPLSVCIEVKKHDSAQLLERMETQLLTQYLKAQSGRTHGTYVVFWFADGDLSSRPGIRTAEELSEFLNQQAGQLSTAPYCLTARVIDCRRLPVPRTKARKPSRKPKS